MVVSLISSAGERWPLASMAPPSAIPIPINPHTLSSPLLANTVKRSRAAVDWSALVSACRPGHHARNPRAWQKRFMKQRSQFIHGNGCAARLPGGIFGPVISFPAALTSPITHHRFDGGDHRHAVASRNHSPGRPPNGRARGPGPSPPDRGRPAQTPSMNAIEDPGEMRLSVFASTIPSQGNQILGVVPRAGLDRLSPPDPVPRRQDRRHHRQQAVSRSRNPAGAGWLARRHPAIIGHAAPNSTISARCPYRAEQGHSEHGRPTSSSCTATLRHRRHQAGARQAQAQPLLRAPRSPDQQGVRAPGRPS